MAPFSLVHGRGRTHVHHLLQMRKIKATSYVTAGGGGQVPSLPHGLQSEPSGLMGFSSALSILLSKLCSTHVRNDHYLQQKNGEILNYLNEPTLLREAPGLAKSGRGLE